MLGFYITYHPSLSASPILADDTLRCEHITFGGWSIERHTLPKFLNHKFFLDEPSFFFSTDGALLNRDELLRQYHCSDITELISILYDQYGETFFRCFRGSFSGVFYDKKKQLMLIFADQTASRLLFWQQTSKSIHISSDLCLLANQSDDIKLDELGLYELLTYGYMPSHHTVINGIRRIPAGHYLRISDGTCRLLQYHRFTNRSVHHSAEEEVTGVDKLFRQAVQRALKVNASYNYSNIFPLSAGLDSRMATWIAHSLTQTPIENFTYGFHDMEDVTEARSIASFLGHKWHFIDQKGAYFYAAIDDMVRHSGMQISYAGMAEATDVFRTIPPEETGIILTGIGGDDILTSPLNRSHKQYSYGECALTTIRYPEQQSLIPKDFSTQYDTRNIFYLYARTFECHAMGSPLAFQQFTESYSPFMDVDFLEFVMSVPESRRKTYRLYDRWILSCYPEAAEWKHNGKTIGRRAPELFICHRHIPFGTITKHAVAYILKHLHIHDFSNTDIPNDYARDAAHIWNEYYETNRHYLAPLGKIAERIEAQFGSGNIQAKIQALTVLAAIKAVQEPRSSGD